MSPLYNEDAGKDAPQPVFRVRSIEAMELFLCPKLEGLHLFSSHDGMPLLHYCVTQLRYFERQGVVRSLVTRAILESLAEQVNIKWASGPDGIALPPGKILHCALFHLSGYYTCNNSSSQKVIVLFVRCNWPTSLTSHF